MTAQTSDIILDRMMSLHPKIIDLTLDRMWRILAALDDPQSKIAPVIHIAGTNGKGSTLAMLRAGLEASGASVCAYTSPHLARFHERIRLPGGLINEEALQEVLAACEAANGGTEITYFEITTAAAFLAFSRAQADWTLLEVGLGGRLDATNVITPEISVITPVSIDHQAFLGETLEEIAFEKAGILKPGIPAFIARQDGAVLDVIERQADTVGAPRIVAGRDWDVYEQHGRLVFQDNEGLLDLPLPRLIGAHQVENAGTVLATLRHLRLSDEMCEAAMPQAIWPARMQRLRSGPLVDAAGPAAEVWLDGGHNPAAGSALAEALGRLTPRPLHAICGMVRSKDAEGFLTPLAPRLESLHAVAIGGTTQMTPAMEIAETASALGIDATTTDDMDATVERIVRKTPTARILICGALYLAGDILKTHE